MIEEYFALNFDRSKSESEGPSVVAYSPSDLDVGQISIPKITSSPLLGFSFELKSVSVLDGGISANLNFNGVTDLWPDYLPNNEAWPLCSFAMMTAVDSALTGEENLGWIKAFVRLDHMGSGENEVRDYYIPFFKTAFDVLEYSSSTFVAGTDHLIRPVYSREKICRYSIFPKPASHQLWVITSSLVVSKSMKRVLQKKGVNGVDFNRVSVV